MAEQHDGPAPIGGPLPSIQELIAAQASMPRWTPPDNYVARGLPPAPELMWDDEEPYIPLHDGYRITPYRATEADYEAVERMSNHPSIAQWSQMRPYPYTRADSLWWFGMHIPLQRASAAALRSDPAALVTHAPVMVIRDPAGRLVGDVGLEAHSGVLSLGYALDPALHGRGLGRAAVGAMIAWAAKHMGSQFTANAQVVNAPSNRVLAGLGFTYVGAIHEPWPEQQGGGTREMHAWRLVVIR
ncbi:acyl-CoA N-acyltransferase [Cutaneotrichosporon oleaginosum]|uniref:Acyl-CoA N-acyltransferase n=1 Tax=Cutaneotrichosporon oleaginosum TaxID=879819 RepID=A0A0J0XX50_9TREE|nr:acyl-CoA N-acyltransferase [Cutaneotrichosporon oleaginosum]KLT45618.1 acyl-CoA N-acyltransferase [Cutaneotrichosporon oleaginosum]TXT04586.1 hypothetical protein COLE_07405 [Cutaneotrichosporon oleaginosum]